MPDEVKPNFLIVGASRCGTTSLYEWLAQHPQAFLPEFKEPSYFVNNYAVSDRNYYLSLFAPGRGKKAIGDASTAYITAPEAPQWIKQELGPVKIIIMLRDPVRRALSLYAWSVMEGWEPIDTFEKALEAEELRATDPDFEKNSYVYFRGFLYFRSGLYHDQVKRYFDTFGRENVRVYLFEDLRPPEKMFGDICKFLEIDPAFKPTFHATNFGRIPRWIPLQYRMRQYRLRQEHAKTPRIWRAGVLGTMDALLALNRKLGGKAEMSPEIESRLRERYREDIQKLATLIDRDLSKWLPSNTTQPALSQSASR